jgi:nucleoside-diphosphate-sugar epimerase
VVDAEACHDRREVRLRRLDLLAAGLGSMDADEGLLDDVLGLADAADHPVGDREQQRPETIAAIRHLEERVVAADGIVLRYGGFYGPGTSLAVGGEMLEAIRRRLFPVVGSGAGAASFIHIEDAARATLAAIERGEPGLYNIVDDEPAPASEWLPYLADAVGARPPRHVPLCGSADSWPAKRWRR